MIAGAGGGFVSSIATCPLDVIKTKLQAQVHAHHNINYLGVWGMPSHPPFSPTLLNNQKTQ
jgi:solute carrier family 25 folate transporter 32